MAIKRLHYFDHQFLVEGDFTDERLSHEHATPPQSADAHSASPRG